ncbi:MAG: transposase [Candidatus Paceibacterota bacterium]|jgi:putative transposase
MRENFVNGKIYHLYNRGADKRSIVCDDHDRFRFTHSLFEFNNSDSLLHFSRRSSQLVEVGLRPIGSGEKIQKREPRKFLVDLIAFCLMDNHYHLMVRQRVDGGVSKFVQKFGTGYTHYFNQRHERSGVLFQGKFKSVPVSDDAQFNFLPFYIHANPFDKKFKEWREKEMKNPKQAIEFLKEYRWSSFPDYVGIKNFPSVTQRELLLDYFGGEKEIEKAFAQWLRDMNEDWSERKRIAFE